MIHERVDSEASKLVRIVGNATFTMVVSSRDMNAAPSTTARASQAPRATGGAAAGAGADDMSVLSGQFVGDDLGQLAEQFLVPGDVGRKPMRLVIHDDLLGNGEVLLDRLEVGLGVEQF